MSKKKTTRPRLTKYDYALLEELVADSRDDAIDTLRDLRHDEPEQVPNQEEYIGLLNKLGDKLILLMQ